MENILLFLGGIAVGAYFSEEVKSAVPVLDKDKATSTS